jgi:hypothetical protein
MPAEPIGDSLNMNVDSDTGREIPGVLEYQIAHLHIRGRSPTEEADIISLC